MNEKQNGQSKNKSSTLPKVFGVDGCRSNLFNILSGIMNGSVMDPLLFRLYTSEHFSILENKRIGDADDSTMIAVVSSSGVRVTVAQFLNRNLCTVSE